MNPVSVEKLRALAGDPVPTEPPGEFSNTLTQALVEVSDWRTNAAHRQPGYVDVRDEDAVLQFTLPFDTIPNVMNTVLDYARMQYRQGKQQGELEAQQRIRAALGFKE